MRILALQLKRIGDLVLTTAALRTLRTAWPEAHIGLGVSDGCASLLGAIDLIDSAIVFGRGRGWASWQQVLTGGWDVCLDFTGTDRSAVATFLSRAPDRRTFAWVRRRKLRSLAYHEFVESSVRDRHTTDHYVDLPAALVASREGGLDFRSGAPAGRIEHPPYGSAELKIPETTRAAVSELLQAKGITRPFALLHPGTARLEKFWLTERWVEFATDLRLRHGLDLVLTGGTDPLELKQLSELEAVRGTHARSLSPDRLPVAAEGAVVNLAGKTDLLTLAALVERAALVVSCDTAVVHLAAAFRRPQVALFGPTNPFHWRPRHDRAVVISASQPERPMTSFQPRMTGAPMDRISTEVVIRATEGLLADQS
ncbi:MAG: glycosyltransferase family 9 protein [Chthoniobacteraceae bacterium]